MFNCPLPTFAWEKIWLAVSPAVRWPPQTVMCSAMNPWEIQILLLKNIKVTPRNIKVTPEKYEIYSWEIWFTSEKLLKETLVSFWYGHCQLPIKFSDKKICCFAAKQPHSMIWGCTWPKGQFLVEIIWQEKEKLEKLKHWKEEDAESSIFSFRLQHLTLFF